ncbi:MAG: hypothetical protein EU530_06645 [Promethearchaeota archaeon]|nr:MAG: hypothetical protein EU530_06645 [Candidatus Lokiarchaeota archaeon]
MTKLKRTSIIFITIAFLVGVGFLLPFYPVSAYPTYPQTGIIGMWASAAPIPEGWVELTAANNRFIMGTNTGENPGATGDFSNHRHAYTQIQSHSHSTSSSTLDHYHSFTGGGTTENKGTSGSDIRTFYTSANPTIGGSISAHYHTVYGTGSATCYTQYTDVLPPYQTVRYIKKVSASALYPVGLIVISTSGVIPSGWLRCDGTNGTPDLRGDFLMGSSTVGLTGGSLSHNHIYTQVPYHTHSMNGYGGSHTHTANHATTMVSADTIWTFAYDVAVATLSTSSTVHYTHGHSISGAGSSTCYTNSQSHLPPYVSVDYIMSTQNSASLPEGVVALWDQTASTIPYGWVASDGTSGTIDLRSKFARGRSSEAPGSTGGSLSHIHSYSSLPYHTHASSSVDAYHTHQMYVYGGIAAGEETLLGLGAPVYTAAASRTTSTTSYYHYHTLDSTGVTSTPSTQSASNYPPYLKLTYIQCNDYEADAPVFTSTPMDRPLEYGYTGERISWTATDSHPNTYTIELIGTGMVVSPTNWGSGSEIIYNIPNGFGVGSYTYEIEVLDKYSRPSTNSVTLTVEDTTSPMLTQVPSPLTVELGYTGQSFTWTATEFNPDYYQIELLDTGIVVEPSGWSSGNPVIYYIPDGFDVGTYTYNITFMDDYGNFDWDTVDFIVEDTTGPTIVDVPNDSLFEYGDVGPLLAWNATDPNPGTYDINLDGVPQVEGIAWTSILPIEFDTTPLDLEVGEYTFTLNISDIYGNYNLDSVTVTVEDTTAPVIEEYATDLTVELGYTDQSFSWNVTDSYAGTYTIERDILGVVEGPSPWVSGSGINYAIPDGLEIGEYLYMLNASDMFGNNITHVVTFTVDPDTTDPVITSIPDDIIIGEGYSGQTLSWTTTDLFPATYIIELDGTGIVVSHTAWTSGGTVSYNIPNGLSAGTYTYTITFYDAHGNSALDSVVFTVTEPPKPSIPGFGVPVILFITACTILTMILVLKRKTKIT